MECTALVANENKYLGKLYKKVRLAVTNLLHTHKHKPHLPSPSDPFRLGDLGEIVYFLHQLG